MHQETFLLFSSERSKFIDKFVNGEHLPLPAETHHLHEFLLIVNRFVGLVQHAEGSQPATGCHVSDLIGRVPDQVFLKNQLFRYVFLGQRDTLIRWVRERIVVMISSACSVTSRNNVFG